MKLKPTIATWMWILVLIVWMVGILTDSDTLWVYRINYPLAAIVIIINSFRVVQ